MRRHVLYIPRDNTGKIIRKRTDLPEGVLVDANGMRVLSNKKPITLKEAFRKINRKRGLSKEQVEEAWRKYEADNPRMGRSDVSPKSRMKRAEPKAPKPNQNVGGSSDEGRKTTWRSATTT